MAKLKTTYEFKNVDVSLEDSEIYEYDKDGDLVDTYSIKSILATLSNAGRIDLSINVSSATIPTKDKEE